MTMKAILIGAFDNEILENLLEFNLDIEIIAVKKKGRGALKTVLNLHPDAVLLNLDLPDISGLRLLERLKKTTTAIIATSEWDTFLEDAMRLGAIDFVTQPVEVALLRKAFSKINVE
jgi:two-component system, LytTR family, response regulator